MPSIPGSAPEAVTCGEAMLLLLATPTVPLADATTFHAGIAGAETNVAVGLARLGHRVRWLGRLGADAAGDRVLAAVRAEGVDTALVARDPDRPTGVLIRDSHPARPIDVLYHRSGSASAHLHPDHLDADALAGARLVHTTGILPMLSESARQATGRLIDLAREHGVTVSLDANVRHRLGSADRWRDVVAPLLYRADLVFAGADELELLLACTPDEAVVRLREAGVDTVVVKGTDLAATATTQAGAWRQEHFAVPVVDPVGAGDGFAAGYLSGWLRGAAVPDCLAEAAAVAALVVQSPADTSGLPTAVLRDRALAGFRSGTHTTLR